MYRALWNGTVIAESDATQVVEGNQYFPPDSIVRELYTSTDTTTVCPWKGTATYFTVTVDGQENRDAAWTYIDPKPEAEKIRDHVAFWKGVEVVEV
jgi:uncharacterized protein (DUF427 family)